MTSDFNSRMVYRKDDRGVILEGAVVSGDDEVPEGFEEGTAYEPYVVTPGEDTPADESKLTSWDGIDLRQTVTEITGQEGDPAGLRSEGKMEDFDPDAERDEDAEPPVLKEDGDEVKPNAGQEELTDSGTTVDEIIGTEGADPRGEVSAGEESGEEKPERRSRTRTERPRQTGKGESKGDSSD